MSRIIVASHNKHKLTELTRILVPMGFDVISAADFEGGISEPEETGTTFEENALIKARSACLETGLIAVADDSGLSVDALGGKPGIYSARFAGTGDDADNRALLLKMMENVPDGSRTAKFVSSVACVFPDGREFTVRGECNGVIGREERGDMGFGYDSLFITEIGCFGEVSAEEKDSISHRKRALEKFKEKIKEYI